MPTSSFVVSDVSALTIPDNATASRSVALGGVGTWARVASINLFLNGLTHTFPGDLDFLVVGPDGTNLLYMSDAGGGGDITNANYTIADSASSSFAFLTGNASGTYKPTDFLTPETSSNWAGLAPITINHPGPTGAATSASAFAGKWLEASTWQLFVRDDAGGDAGSLGSWGLSFTYNVIVKPHDFNGGVAGNASDILFQNSDGTPGIWLMNGFNAISVGPAGPNAPWPSNPGPSWHAKGDGDFNNDGQSDILWQNNDGTPGIWLMNGLTAVAMSQVGTNPGPGWQVKGTGDFNFDSNADILWQNVDGTPGIWLMNGFAVLNQGAVGTNPGPSWHVIGSGDFNNDGKSDILWQNDSGQAGIWLMDGLTVLNQAPVGTNPGAAWQIKGTGDFNNDGRADILWQNNDGSAGIWLMDGLTILNQGPVGTNPGTSWHIKGSGDYNNDDKSDILWQNDDGTPGIWTMNGLSVLNANVAGSFNPGSDWHIIG